MTKTRDLADLGGGFIQAGTGAVQRTVESKLQDVVSVKDFGAVGDGVANDTAAIQAALNYAISQNKPLHFGPGIFYHASPINYTVTQADRYIRILLDGGSLKAGALSVGGFTLDGSTYRPPISIEGPGRFIGTELIINPGVASGSYLGLARFTEVSVADLEFDSGPKANGKGDSAIVPSQCSRVTISNCKFRGWNDHGIYFTGPAVGQTNLCEEAVVTGCNFHDLSGAIRWARSGTNLIVSANTFKDCYNCVIAAGGNTNWNPGNSVNITGNIVDGCDACAFDLRYFSEGVVISGNLVYDWNLAGLGSAINLRGISRAVVVGNAFLPKDQTNPNPVTNTRCASGIYIQSATNDDLSPPDNAYSWPGINNLISNNIFGILQSDGATGGRNAAIIDMVGNGSNSYTNNKFVLNGTAFAYWVNDSGSNGYYGDPWIMHAGSAGFGIGTDAPTQPLTVVNIIRSEVSVNDAIELIPGTATHTIKSTSPANSAQKLFINATTDASNTTPTGGAIGLNLRVLNVDKISCNIDDVQVQTPLRLRSYATASLPTSGISAGSIAYDSTTNTVKFYNGSTWANI
jgi:hypothetical protein